MSVRYDKLWILLIKNKMKKGELAKAAHLSSHTMTQLNNNRLVSMSVMLRFVCLSSGLIQMGRAAFAYIILCPCRCSGKGGSIRRSRPNSVFVTQSFSMQS